MLPIFPEGGLASSVITTVWVGVFLLCFFNLRYGWVLSGLVVPGYLVPLLIVKPMAAFVITFEAILTYLIVIIFSEYVGKGRWSSLFGRDRFMGLILASIGVRLAMDGYILPQLASWLAENWDRQFDWQSNFQSFGLVIISLLANQFWKPGLARGLYSTVVITFLTWLIVRYGLMEFTNFHISGVSYLFEGLASSILASPKAYIILVLTALIASQMNVRYGWDFSGILIPALIALQWYQPEKILTSFVEAGIIYFLARLVLKLPAVANANIEGARKLLLFFNVSFAYKLLLGHAVVLLAIDIKTSDLYGFGYLLSTLIAIKAHDKDIFPRLMRSTLEVSLAGAVLGNLAGLLISIIKPQAVFGLSGSVAKVKAADTSAAGQLVAATIGEAYLHSKRLDNKPLSREAADALASAIEILEAEPQTAEVAGAIAGSGLRIQSNGDGTLALLRGDATGGELLLFNPSAQKQFAISVPDPTQTTGLGAAALALFRSSGARWLIITSPAPPGTILDRTALGLFRSASKLPELALVAAPAGQVPLAQLRQGVAEVIDIAALRKTLTDLRIGFGGGEAGSTPLAGDAALLQLDRKAIEQLTAKLITQPVPLPPEASVGPTLCSISRDPVNNPEPNPLPRLAFLRYEIAEPLVLALSQKQSPVSLAASAKLAGFVLDSCVLGETQHWRLVAAKGNEGTYLFAPNGDPTRIIHSFATPDGLPIQTSEALHREWGSMLLAVAPEERTFREAQRSSFGVMSQTTIRAMGEKPGQLLQLRASRFSAPDPGPEVDLVISTDRIEPSGLWVRQISALTQKAGIRSQRADRAQAQAGYEKESSPSILYLDQAFEKRYATLWLRRKPKAQQK